MAHDAGLEQENDECLVRLSGDQTDLSVLAGANLPTGCQVIHDQGQFWIKVGMPKSAPDVEALRVAVERRGMLSEVLG